MAQKHLALVSNPVGWQNPYVGSFNGHLRRELLELESFKTLFEAQLLLEDRRLEYKHYRPH